MKKPLEIQQFAIKETNKRWNILTGGEWRVRGMDEGERGRSSSTSVVWRQSAGELLASGGRRSHGNILST